MCKKNQGVSKPSILVVSAIMLAVLAAAMVPAKIEAQKGEAVLTDVQAMLIVGQRCVSCHAVNPANPSFASAPAGIVLETVEQALTVKERMILALQTGYMPLGNMTNMTDQERQQLMVWLSK